VREDRREIVVVVEMAVGIVSMLFETVPTGTPSGTVARNGCRLLRCGEQHAVRFQPRILRGASW